MVLFVYGYNVSRACISNRNCLHQKPALLRKPVNFILCRARELKLINFSQPGLIILSGKAFLVLSLAPPNLWPFICTISPSLRFLRVCKRERERKRKEIETKLFFFKRNFRLKVANSSCYRWDFFWELVWLDCGANCERKLKTVPLSQTKHFRFLGRSCTRLRVWSLN